MSFIPLLERLASLPSINKPVGEHAGVLLLQHKRVAAAVGERPRADPATLRLPETAWISRVNNVDSDAGFAS